MTIGLAIFAKNPEFSPVKTRLISSLGNKKTVEFYYLCLAATQQLAEKLQQHTGVVTPHWAISEEETAEHPLWRQFPVILTGEGSFGQCLANVYTTLKAKYSKVVLFGTDSPHLSIVQLEEVMQQVFSLNTKQCIVGPCTDGGFYLFAGACQIPSQVWLDVEYSSNTTLACLQSELDKVNLQVKNVSLQTDIDYETDLVIVKEQLSKHEYLLPKQQILLDWLTINNDA